MVIGVIFVSHAGVAREKYSSVVVCGDAGDRDCRGGDSGAGVSD